MSKPVILTIISPKELPAAEDAGFLDKLLRPIPWVSDSRQNYLSQFTAVSCKFSYKDQANGKAVYKPYPRALIDAAGCERHAWEYLEFANETEATAVGTRLGQLCYKYEIHTLWANGEDGTAGTGKYPRYASPYKNMTAFVVAFRRAAPSYTKLAYNGYSWSRTSAATGGRLLHDPTLIRQFDIWSPMNYATSVATLREYWQAKCFKYVQLQSRVPVIPTIGVGRVDASGATWGDWEPTLDLLIRTNVDGVNFFFGNGAKPQMLIGNKRHQALVKCVPDLRARGW